MKYFTTSLNKLRLSSIVLLTSLAIVGCTPTLDTSSEEGYNKSIEEMQESLNDEQRFELKKALEFYSSNKRPDKYLFGLARIPTEERLKNSEVIKGSSYEEIIQLYKKDYAQFKKVIAFEKREKYISEKLIKLTKSYKFDEAYKEVTEIKADEVRPNFKEEMKTSIDNAKKALEERQQYFKNLEVFDFVADVYNDGGVQRQGVGFSIKNLGSKTITSLGVKFVFRDTQGNVIGQEEFQHIKSEFPMRGHDPLKGGETRVRDRNDYFAVSKNLENWSPEKTTMQLIYIEFDVSDKTEVTVDPNAKGNGHTEITAKTKYVIQLDEYKDFIDITNFKIRKTHSVGEQRVGVRFDMTNNGSIKIKQLEITVFLKNDNGDVVYQEAIKPIDAAFDSDFALLLPCQTKNMEGNSVWGLKHGYEGFVPEKTEFKITALKFTRGENEDLYVKPNYEGNCKK